MYRFLFERVLSRFDAESVHKLAFFMLRLALGLGPVRALVRSLLAPRDPRLVQTVFGKTLDSPVGLAAGFDKDAVGFEALYALGFGFIEIGTLTGEAQPGNDRPRMFRLVEDRALLNRLGFNNGGSAGAVARLSAPRSAPLGVNIGKTKRVAEADALADYVLSAKRLASSADYFVVNVSSPNTPGLRNLQAVSLLRPLLAGVRAALDEACPARKVPLLVKIAPDLADEDVDGVADLALELGLDGIIATNTTISRTGLKTDASRVEALGAGGVSGAPLKARSLAVLERLRGRVGARLVLVSVGGVETPEDVLARILAGATLVQVYTGFIYGGPLLPSRLARGLSALLAARGFANVADAVGKNAR
jgi:dihydroorotate dehydrogenase